VDAKQKGVQGRDRHGLIGLQMRRKATSNSSHFRSLASKNEHKKSYSYPST
jgi:hypothetical protein